MTPVVLVAAIVLLALVFDFLNGKNDAANIVATMITSRSISPGTAVAIAAVCEFIGPFLLGTAVAKTIGKGIVDPAAVDAWTVSAALISAISWNIVAWYFGFPSSSSHALVGGLAGAVAAGAGVEKINLAGLSTIVAVLVVTPAVAFAAGYLFLKTLMRLAKNATPRLNEGLKRAQLLSSAALALSHGANDAQKSMGVITMVLVASGYLDEFVVPLWVVFACATAISLGTASGSWRIIKTVGAGIYKLRPAHAFSAQTSSALVILVAAVLGGPVSTSHVVSSGIMGIGSAERIRAVRWHKAQEILAAWALTIPASAAIAAFVFLALRAARGLR